MNYCHFRRSQMREIMLEIPSKQSAFIFISSIWDTGRYYLVLFVPSLCFVLILHIFRLVWFFSSVWKLWGVSPGLMASSAPSSSAPDMDPNTANLRQPATSRSLWITRFSLGLFTPWGGDVHHCLKKHTAPCEMSISWQRQLERQIINHLMIDR